MTSLHKRVTRLTHVFMRDGGSPRQIVVHLDPPGLLVMRLKGKRRTYAIPLDACYSLAVKAHVAADRKAKKSRKKTLGRRKLRVC